MYNLSPISYAILQQLKSQNIPSPRRAQMLELIAAYIGYKTFAAFKADSKNNEDKITQALLAQEAARIRLDSRLMNLGLPESLSETLEHQIIHALQTMNSEPKISHLKIAQFLDIGGSSAALSANEEKLARNYLINSNEPDSVLFRYVWQVKEREEALDEDYTEASEYWFKQRKAGVEISGAAKEWADAYERQLAAAKDYEDFISAYAETIFPSPNIESVMKQNAEPNFCCKLDASYLSELFESFRTKTMTSEFIRNWHYMAALQSLDHQTLVSLAEDIDDDIELWALYLFGQQNNIDITKDNHWAVNSDTGGHWDEVGPFELAGYDGIPLPEISNGHRQEAEFMAARMQKVMNFRDEPS